MELFNTSKFSSLDETTRDFEIENLSSKKKVGRCGRPLSLVTLAKTDSAWDDGEAFPEVSSKNFKVGDRVTTSHPLCKGKIYTIAKYPSIDGAGNACYVWIETTCNLLLRCDSLTYAQESEPDFVTPACNSDSNSAELQKSTNIVVTFSENDIQECITMETCEKSQDLRSQDSDIICTPVESTLLQPAPLVPPFPERDLDSEQMTSGTASPPCLKPSENYSQDSQPSKTLPACSTAQPPQEKHPAHILEESSDPLTASGMMQNGLLSEAGIVEVPLLEKEYCWLPSPGALSSTGKGRPPGQTKQEGELKKLGLLQKDEVLNPAILSQWYGLPENWLDPSESRAATELLENNEQQQEIYSTPKLQESHSAESSTSTQLESNLAPEIFLEESQQQLPAVQKPKGRQRKGCLYKYIENKKLKSGVIASYPRVMGHRNPDNPRHWRWGFNWEEKIDGEWKGRSIGSVPIGVIALIQSMQKSGVPLEEIIAFIRRSKNKG